METLNLFISPLLFLFLKCLYSFLSSQDSLKSQSQSMAISLLRLSTKIVIYVINRKWYQIFKILLDCSLKPFFRKTQLSQCDPCACVFYQVQSLERPCFLLWKNRVWLRRFPCRVCVLHCPLPFLTELFSDNSRSMSHSCSNSEGNANSTKEGPCITHLEIS